MLQIKLPTKLSFWAVASALAGAATWLVSSGLVPPSWAGVAAGVSTLLGAIMAHKPAGEP